MPSSSSERDGTAPPTYAWDWFGRQRLLWREARDRLGHDHSPPPAARVASPVSDVPDWDGRRLEGALGAGPGPAQLHPARDYPALDTRAELVAALRADYPIDARVREIVDAVVAELAFLGRCDGDLAGLGMRTPPRGLRWWWTHLGGSEVATGPSGSDANETVPVQLRLVDVQAGYGDHAGTFEWSTR
jgi:hypothetical protein